MSKRSLILGLFTLVGLIVGLIVKAIAVWTLVGMAVGYVVTFWVPYFKKRLQQRNK